MVCTLASCVQTTRFESNLPHYLSVCSACSHTEKPWQDVKVPLSVLGFLDQGQNPLLATEESLRRSLERNKELNGKLELYSKFRAALLHELEVSPHL